MKSRFLRKLTDLKSAVIAADPVAATACLEDLAHMARRGLGVEERAQAETSLSEIRDLAQASERGARQAIEQIRAIVEAARSLQTYDSAGRRHATSTTARAPHRF